MSTTTIQQNVVYGLGEGTLVSDTTMLAYALRYANKAYRDIFNRYRFKHLRKRVVFRTSDGQSTYQAPEDFIGFLILKDESGDSIIDQRTPEQFEREIGRNTIEDESFTADHDVAVSLDNVGIIQYSETVTTTDDATEYTRGTDYTMDYAAGTITVDSTGSMSDSTSYEIDYLYRSTGSPSIFCLEYDSSAAQYVVRMDPVPDGTKIVSLLYPAMPSNLSSSAEPIWDKLEFALEQGGIYFGSLELIDDAQKRKELKMEYESAIQALIQMDLELIPKRDRIRLVLRRSDYTDTTDWMS